MAMALSIITSDIYIYFLKRVLRGSLLACHLAAKMQFIHDDQKKNGTHLEKNKERMPNKKYSKARKLSRH
jgi:hypothetical protein